MKKIISMCLIIPVLFSILCFFCVSKAETAPVYDATYNNNAGAFYANGAPITINTDSSNNTVVYWDGGSQVVPSTVTIFGGGTNGTSYESSNITMENGTVSLIYGGGISLNENEPSIVKNANVTVNNGTILTTLMGGGIIYTNVENTNITINGGTVAAVVGGGAASAKISGVSYSAGKEGDLINSKNRTTNTNVVINNGIIDMVPSNYGLVFGGGQGLSYVENANLIINGGDLSKAYVTAGGSNGYTENGKIEITNGSINVLQTTNRGIVNTATVKVTGGNIINAYVGGETDPSVTGVINKAEFDVLGGKVTNLNTGTSGGTPIEVEKDKFKVVYIENAVENNNVGPMAVSITYMTKVFMWILIIVSIALFILIIYLIFNFI